MIISILPPNIRDMVINATAKNSGESKSNIVAGKVTLAHVLAIPFQVVATLSTCYAYYVNDIENLMLVPGIMVKILLKFSSFRGESLKDKLAAVQIFMEYMLKGTGAVESFNTAVNNVNKKHYLLSGYNFGNNNNNAKNTNSKPWNNGNNNFNSFGNNNGFNTNSFTKGNGNYKRSYRGRGRGGRSNRGGRGGNSNNNNGVRGNNKRNGLENNPSLEEYNNSLPSNSHVCTGINCRYNGCGNRGFWSMDRAFHN